MRQAIKETNFNLPKQKSVYHGKVRDVYNIDDKYMVMVATDRISAFDVVLPKPIPYKGQVLNQIAAKFLEATEDIVPNWLLSVPDPRVSVGFYCEPFMVEMVIRGYLAGHAWREYKAGKRKICGVAMPDGMKENDKFPEPILTPTIKATSGHDEDISRDEILSSGLVNDKDYMLMEYYTRELFHRGSNMAEEKGLLLVDTKYEFGKRDGRVYLIDEVHTPDSSRYFYSEGYDIRQDKGERQKQLSKEFVREWLMENGFQGLEGQEIPNMPEEFVEETSERYIELFETITGDIFHKSDSLPGEIEHNLKAVLEEMSH